ncbi:UDP-N-acetylenolpyruvoylglucosamine reductase [Drechslerella dactyloides]|uniref:UDP-N-acetylmuramate dehydrogenase n=1 Tax=Drechslerella dactyloides TaxID=74499 RepID=A0AAD6IS13_DREDA|nr:UDP-N-acetylenolpyruvoylglucosamine reductase [Drechslerella dactyloides]
MRLGGTAEWFVEVRNRGELEEATDWARRQKLPVIVVGDGSNIIWRDEGFQGLIIRNRIMHYEERPVAGEAGAVYVDVGAGETWDNVVARTAAHRLTGIEALSSVPGTAGATPIQNVGAYGQEIADTLVSLEAYDFQTGQHIVILASDCSFGYRTSRFKTDDRGRFCIIRMTLKLQSRNPQPPFYPAVQQFLEENGAKDPAPQMLRDAVIAIRRAKLPDPEKIANCGSFFRNPLSSEIHCARLLANYPEMPHWHCNARQVKISAAWLIEQAGFKDFYDKETGMATWPMQSLVVINKSAKHTSQLLVFRQNIIDIVGRKFGIALEQEPDLLP